MKKKINFYLIAILILAFVLRFWKLGTVPHGMAWDEAAIAYNGYAIWTTHLDEWMTHMPISFKSFGDYKAPFAIYLNGIFTTILGMNLFVVRLPFALASLAAILGFYLLVKELFWQSKKKEIWASLAAFLLTVSPWHIHYSRLAFESGLALAALIWSLYFVYLYIRKEKIVFLLFSSFLAALNFYIYHSSKVTVPLLIMAIVISNWQFFRKKWKELLIAALLASGVLYFFIKDAFWGEGLTRAGSSILFQGLSFKEILTSIAANFLSYFSIDFLIKGANAGELRHSDGRFGVLNLSSFVLIIIYLFSLLKKIIKKEKLFLKNDQKVFSLSTMIIILGLLPAVIAEGKFHSNRAFLALPGFLILVVLAIKNFSQNIKISLKKLIVILVAVYLFLLSLYQFNYYKNYSKESTAAFMDGYIEVFSYLKSTDKAGIEKILFTADYQQPYIYALFVNKLSPIAYQGGILNLFEFNNKVDSGDLSREKTIVVASNQDQMGDLKADKEILGADGSVRFRIYLPQEK
jgi:4-amino-4-deoxy-L-arabinose transferase-like glycosyltransferase